jgi:hypothetical protein
MAQAVSHHLLTAEAPIRARGSPCRTCGGQSDTGKDTSSNTLVVPCQYHCNVAKCTHVSSGDGQWARKWQ